MQKKKTTKPIKQIILFIIAVILLLLLIFAEDIIKLVGKNKINLAENNENELISNEPNAPQLSAGMIPVKWDGTNWIITTSKDKDWYDYSKGKPAYIMLNDGTYQSELIRDMNGKKLASDVAGRETPIVSPDQLGTIFVWIPRFAEGDNEEIEYLKEETIPSDYWVIPRMFSYEVADDTKPNYYLSGVWIEKDVDEDYESKITQMNKEESIYGFIKNTNARKVSGFGYVRRYIDKLSELVADDGVYPQINDITSANRIMLRIINTNKVEPIKADIIYNKQEQKIEIQVTYTSNGIREILDDNGKPMTLTEENGIVYTDTGDTILAKGTYKFTVVDKKGNKKELSITPNIDSLYKVAYINGTDNMDNTATYAKMIENKTTDENTLLVKLYETTSTVYTRAIADSNKAITAIGLETRTDEDEQLYYWGKHNVVEDAKCNTTRNLIGENSVRGSSYWYIYSDYSVASDGTITLSNLIDFRKSYVKGYAFKASPYSSNGGATKVKTDTLYELYVYKRINWNGASPEFRYNIYSITIDSITITYSKGDFISTMVAKDGTYTIGSSTSVHSDGYWYTKGGLAPKYTLYKYDQNLNLLSAYDVDSKVLTTAPINISNKGNNKLKLTLNTTGSDYKTYISNDNTNWQEVTDITSNTAKELNVDGWDNLYIKIETNSSRINSIDVAFYKA